MENLILELRDWFRTNGKMDWQLNEKLSKKQHGTFITYECKKIDDLFDSALDKSKSIEIQLKSTNFNCLLPTIDQCLDKIDELGDSFAQFNEETGDETWDGFAISKENAIKLIAFIQSVSIDLERLKIITVLNEFFNWIDTLDYNIFLRTNKHIIKEYLKYKGYESSRF